MGKEKMKWRDERKGKKDRNARNSEDWGSCDILNISREEGKDARYRRLGNLWPWNLSRKEGKEDNYSGARYRR